MSEELAEIYTFEYIIDQANYPKAYGRKFVVLEKYQELLEEKRRGIWQGIDNTVIAFQELQAENEKLVTTLKKIARNESTMDDTTYCCLAEQALIELGII